MFIIVFCHCIFFHLPQKADLTNFIKIISFLFIINHYFILFALDFVPVIIKLTEAITYALDKVHKMND